jgi:hypothetical protein
VLARAAADNDNSHYLNDLRRATELKGDTDRTGLFR